MGKETSRTYRGVKVVAANKTALAKLIKLWDAYRTNGGIQDVIKTVEFVGKTLNMVLADETSGGEKGLAVCNMRQSAKAVTVDGIDSAVWLAMFGLYDDGGIAEQAK